MKKLLALILCVMMFVSVLSTSAFAVYPFVDDPLANSNTYAREIKNMIKNTKDNIKNAYGVLIMDESVYTSAKFMDDTIVGLIDAISADLIGKKIVVYKEDGTIDPTKTAYPFTKKDVDTVKKQVRYLIDGMVATKMAENDYKYITKYNDDGSIEIDPIKYAQVFSQAVSDSLTNKDFQKGYEAVATYFALSSLVKDVNDKMKDEYQDFYNSVDKDFDKDFQKNYPALWTQYIDTLTDAASGLYILDDPWATQTEYPVPVDNGWFSNVHENTSTSDQVEPVPAPPATTTDTTPDEPAV